MSDQLQPVDLNTASLDELSRIPGIGPAIAARIQSRRPYNSVDELTTVPGIGEAALEKIRQYLIPLDGDNSKALGAGVYPDEPKEDEPLPESQLYEADAVALPAAKQVELLEAGATIEEEPQEQSEVEMQQSDESVEPEILMAEEELIEEEEPIKAYQAEQETGPTVVIPETKPATKDQPRYASRADAFWISFGSSFLVFILAIGLTLGALALINNGLRYVSPAQLSSVIRQVDGLSSQASILQQDLDGLRTRVDNIEGLSGRVSTVEQSTEQLRGDLDAAYAQVEQLNQSISSLQSDVTELRSVSDRFQNFLNGLRELLNNEQQ